MGPAGIVAMLAGWITTEVGRQPWVVSGVQRTVDAASLHSATQLGISLGLFVVVYVTVFGAGIGYILRLLAQGPAAVAGGGDGEQPAGGPGQSRHALRPLSAVADSHTNPPTGGRLTE
jgi:cytochrome bd ubiquinol oxidase subunit I